MYKTPLSIEILFLEAESVNLYEQLVLQLNKDFNLGNEPLDFPASISSLELKNQLHEKIYKLIQYKFDAYLSLLYIIDVSEAEIKKLDGSDVLKLSEQVCFLVLKREWQKVWFRNKY